MSRLRDRRLWLGFAITALALWFAFRDVSFVAIGHELARANWWLLLGVSLPAYWWSVQLRAERWRVLARGVADVPSGPAYRATAVGFLVNNVLPLRLGEFVRAWWLAREIRASAPALLGTVILERVIDFVFVLGLAALVIGNQIGNGLGRGALLAGAAVPLAATLALRRWPGPMLRGVRRFAGLVLPAARADRLTGIAGAVAQGVAALRGGADFVRMAWQTVVLWCVAAVIPFWVALVALGIDLGGLAGQLRGSFLILVYVAAAVALPAAPGFFGPYHAACRYALTPLGVSKELALAFGTLAQAVFWVGTSALGLVAMRGGNQRFSEAVSVAESQVEPNS